MADFKAALQPVLTGGVYMNFLEGEESQKRVQDGFSPKAFRQLQAVKAAHDPEQYLQYSMNITPKA